IFCKLWRWFVWEDLSNERDAVQKKTFTKWVNSHLARVSCRISDLYNDLRDGYMLTRLLEVLSGELLVGAIVVLVL
uniref:Calponin-homology (CH) domain-containing protein n=1 Tax=Neolamprologus brichardi TaxID=32507 RepID=A0A3Q4MJ01_NEOBR